MSTFKRSAIDKLETMTDEELFALSCDERQTLYNEANEEAEEVYYKERERYWANE